MLTKQVDKHGLDKYGLDKHGLDKHGLDKHGLDMVLINYSFDMVLTNMVIKEIARSLGLTFNLVFIKIIFFLQK